MDKKQLIKSLPSEELKGFEEFIEGEPADTTFLPKPPGNSAKKEVSFEHFTFLTNDGDRLSKLKVLVAEKIPFSSQFDQSHKIIKEQEDKIEITRAEIFRFSDQDNSPFRRSIGEIFNSFFDPPKN